MTPYYQSESVTLYNGDAVTVMRTLADCSVDSIVTDPPAGISFMGKDWDHHKGGRDAWVAWLTEVMRECLRVLKPGGHALVWALPRTSHWTAWAIEGAGFQIRDRVSHLFGTGFPKALDISKAIDAAAGVERTVIGLKMRPDGKTAISARPNGFPGEHEGWDRPWKHDQEHVQLQSSLTAPATDAAKQWEGWATALKPACEDWWLCRKPLEGTVAQNILKHGTGGLNIDGCRVETNEQWSVDVGSDFVGDGGFRDGPRSSHALGRWPANVITDGSEEVLAGFPETDASRVGMRGTMGESPFSVIDGSGRNSDSNSLRGHNDDGGSAARFFYTAKASKQDREEGLEDLELLSAGQVTDRQDNSAGLNSPRAGAGRNSGSRNHHPTVKPLALMRYLVRLITPPDGLVLDCFCGSGSTGKAAVFEDFRFIGIELDEDYCKLAQRRIKEASRQNRFKQGELFTSTATEYQRQVEPPEQSGLFATVAGE